MQLKSRGLLLALVAVFAMSAVAVASASAALPEFKPIPTKKKFTSTSGKVIFQMAGATRIECAASTTTGEFTGAQTLGKTIIKFTGCKIPNAGGGGCEVDSIKPSGKNGEFVTNALKGELGTLEKSVAPSEVGLLLEPETGNKTWFVLENNTCIGESNIAGKLAPEVVTVGKKQLTNSLAFKNPKGGTEIFVKGAWKKAELNISGSYLGMETTDALTFEEALEVT
jgi:hypothetical protein